MATVKMESPMTKRCPEEMSTPSSGSKRLRRPVERFEPQELKKGEEQAIYQAIKNSLVETRLMDRLSIPEALILRPTIDQWADPIEYVRSIRSQAEAFGICKIIPPAGWNPPPNEGYFNKVKHFMTKRQELKLFKEGTGFSEGRLFAFDEYKSKAQAFSEEWRRRYAKEPTFEDLERDYWRIIETCTEDVVVDYGNDVDTLMFGSGFPRAPNHKDKNGTVNVDSMGSSNPCLEDDDYYERCGWNLNNLPFWPGSVLRDLRAPVNGVNVPWVYFGCLFATFCWHAEDNYMYSMNYHHSGAPKQWYGVPGKFASKFEAVIRGIVMDSFRDQPNLLYCMTTQMSPELLSNSGVPVYRMIQQPGEFILTFPKAFHAGFSYGFNIAEAVNFCTPDWLPFGREAIDAYRRVARPSVLSHERLVLTLAHNVRPDWSQEVMYNLLKDLERIVRDEEAARNRAQLDGLRFGIVPKSRLQKNNLVYVDVSGMDYDEKRTCHECKDICFISAVACECSQEKVSCLRHYATMCRCPLAKRFALIWHEMDELWGLVERVKNIAARRGVNK